MVACRENANSCVIPCEAQVTKAKRPLLSFVKPCGESGWTSTSVLSLVHFAPLSLPGSVNQSVNWQCCGCLSTGNEHSRLNASLPPGAPALREFLRCLVLVCTCYFGVWDIVADAFPRLTLLIISLARVIDSYSGSCVRVTLKIGTLIKKMLSEGQN